ncbi:hypothetical protein C4D60_Mb06t29100 [Musa balbisiana]|uniref:Uncharacterized protein n=1 Tax=Musa balbisiana TaxID=52838 RepID=A0A4S8IRG4_MUSBA|nr:hypothetical protein C4D60_Mb06t29100 [Musa balbisiana]
MALIAVVAPALYVVAVVGVLFVVNIYHRGDPDEDIEAVITRADDKAADSGESELQVGGNGQESGVETHVKTMPEKVVEAGNPEGREAHHRLPDAGAALVALRQEQRKGRNGSRGSGEKFQITSAESEETRSGKGADSEARQHINANAKPACGSDDEIPRSPLQQKVHEKPSQKHDQVNSVSLDRMPEQHINANAKPACGSDDESPRSPLQQKVHGKPSQKHDQVNSVSLDRLPEQLHTTLGASGVTQPANGEMAIQQVQTLLNQPTDERVVVLRSSREEVIKSAMKFSYMSVGISGGALVTIFFGHYVNQRGQSHSFQLKIMLASFVSGVSIPLLNFLQHHHISVSLQLFRSLKCTAFALLVLALLDVSILFMKILALFAFVPTIAVNQPTDERVVVLRSSREEVIKSAMKFSYMSVGISGGALVTIFFGHYVNQRGQSHSFQLKIMLASFVSGVSIPLLNFLQHHHISVSLQLFRSLKCTAFALLVLALLDVSILFMKILALFAFVPTIAVVVIVYGDDLLALYSNGGWIRTEIRKMMMLMIKKADQHRP